MWANDFGDKLAIRERSQHSQCWICVRHKLIIRKLSKDKISRQLQLKAYERHLETQYKDRICYWSDRSASRLPRLPCGGQTVSIICDAMDHSKYRYPRSEVFSSKEFGGFVRPSLDATAIIIHGYLIFVGLSEAFTKKDSSWSTDLLYHSLDLLSMQIDLREVDLNLQSDNCVRETKNNTLTRAAAYLVGTRRCRSFTLKFLMSGHSHEDIDQMFSMFSNVIEQKKELHTPWAFVQLLRQYFEDKDVRPNEPHRFVEKVDVVRHWNFGDTSLLFSFHLNHQSVFHYVLSFWCKLIYYLRLLKGKINIDNSF